MASIFLPGRPVEIERDASTWPEELDGVLELELQGATRIDGPSRGAGGMDETSIDDVAPNDILEIELEDGLRIWQSVESAQIDYQVAVARSGEDQTLLLPRQLTFPGQQAATRGVGTHLVKAIRLFRGKPVGDLGEAAAVALAHKIEDKVAGGFGKCIRRMEDGVGTIEVQSVDLSGFSDDDRKKDQKCLVLVHGTFSYTQGSFGGLAAADKDEVWEKLKKAYPGGIYGFDHRSVTESPMRNAADLVKALPKGMRVTFLTHSRGGMVAELVARGSRADFDTTSGFDDTDAMIFDKAGASDLQKAEMAELKAALAARKLRVERIVRVAGPIAGTTLASKRLDHFISVGVNLMGLIPVLRATPAAGLLKAFLMAFIETRADATQLPGLEAMIPESATTRILNRGDFTIDSDLHVIGGDTEGSGVFRRLAVLAADLLFWGEHDFVVDQASMDRGAPRRATRTPFLVQGPSVTHMTYFHEALTQREIVNAIVTVAAPVLAASRGARLEDAGAPPPFPALLSRGDKDLPTCILLPGVMGSHLRQSRRWIWTNPLQLATGGISRLSMTASDVTAADPIARYYGDLAKFLSITHHVIPFDYDWRLSILDQGHQDTTRKLGHIVEKALADSDRPLRFMAHSMGGLLVRSLFQTQPELWAKFKARVGSRFVMLGTPNGGSIKMIRTLLGRDAAIRQLAMLDMAHSLEELLAIVAEMPGALQLMPLGGDTDYFSTAFWDKLVRLHGAGWVKPSAQALRQGREGLETLHMHQLDPETTCYVAGKGEEPTISSFRLIPTAQGAARIQFYATPMGDGTVTWASGIPKGVPTWYTTVPHGDMPRHAPDFPALLDLLETGKTRRLRQTPPLVVRGAGAEDIAVPQTDLTLFPEPDDVLDSFIGAGHARRPVAAPAAPVTEVSISHGNLRFASYPVAVGHYEDDPMMGAEAALDSCLDYRLSRVREMGIYPGKLGSCEVIVQDDCAPTGALVVGLGRFGSLTPGHLQDTFRRAVLRYGLIFEERAQGRADHDVPPLGLTTLLIGHQDTNITIQQSVEAIMAAVAEANKILTRTPITHLQIMEIFDDSALHAASAIEKACDDGRMAGAFHFDKTIATMPGALMRSSYGRQADWWQRISVSRRLGSDDTLDFEVASGSARVSHEISNVPPQMLLALTRQKDTGVQKDSRVGRLLFELLMPLGLKKFATDNQKILLVLDEVAAAYPWELMEDDHREFDGVGVRPMLGVREALPPLVVTTPIIRQLQTSGMLTLRATNNQALVVGDPQSSHGYTQLLGAQAEAKDVARLLGKSLGVKPLIAPENGMDVLGEMLTAPYKVMHLAGHGVDSAPGTTGVPGMVLGGDLYLTANQIMGLRAVPEFVFLNCCHLGHVGEGVAEIASSLSVAFIRKGVRAVIAAGWEVDDTAAHLFAHTFYEEMLQGSTFGQASHQARVKVYQAHADTNTWGAYQCYGDPDYRFRDPTGKGADATDPVRFYSREQGKRAVHNIIESAASARTKRHDLLARLAAIETGAPPDWIGDSGWNAIMGLAYSKLGSYEIAIDYYERAISRDDGATSTRTIERFNNIRVIHAGEQFAAAVDAQEKATRLDELRTSSDAALACFDLLDQVAGKESTAERHSLRGSVHKVVAMSETGRGRAEALDRMTQCYAAARRHAAEIDPDRLDVYTTQNWVTGLIVSGQTEGDGSPVSVWLDRLTQAGEADDRRAASFWNGIVVAEIDILRGVLDAAEATDDRSRQIQAGIKRAWVRGGSTRQAMALHKQLRFLLEMQEPRQRKQISWLKRIMELVHEITDDVEG